MALPVKKFILITILTALALPLFSEEAGSGSKAGDTTGGKESDKKEERSIVEDWREVLLFGIADEVLEIVKKIKDAKEESLNREMVKVLAESVNTDVQNAILDYFNVLKYRDAESVALSMLGRIDEPETSLKLALINYLAAIQSEGLKDIINNYVESENDSVSVTAIEAIGKINDISRTGYLLEKLDNVEFPDLRKPTILLVLGTLKAVEAVDKLIEIVTDPSRDIGWRMYACDSLGKIRDDRALPVLKKLFSEQDALLRAYAASALSAFNLSDVIDLLIQGLKDANYRVRTQCAIALAKKGADKAVDILVYKVKNDPVNAVRIESVKALAEIGKKESFDFLAVLFAKKNEAPDIRVACMNALVDKNLEGFLPAMKKFITDTWDAPVYDFRMFEVLARKLSETKSPLLEEVFKKILAHINVNIRLYAIRGIAFNKFTGLKDRIETLSKEDPVQLVRREALLALTKF